MLLGLTGLLLAAAPELSLSIVDAEDLGPEELVRLQSDLSFELQRHTGLTVVPSPLARQFPAELAPPGLWVRAFRGVAQVRLILEDRRAGQVAKAESADLEWPLSASRSGVQALLSRVLGPSLAERERGPVLTWVEPADDAGGASVGPAVLGLSGALAGGVALGFALASAMTRSGVQEAELRPAGQSQEVATLTSVAFIGLGVAGACLLGSVLWAMSE